MKLVSWIALSLVSALPCACSRGSYVDDEEGEAGSGGSGGSGLQPLPKDTDFVIRPEWEGPCETAKIIDVNLGNAPESFVRAAQCQIAGSEPDPATIDELAGQLRKL